MVKQTTRCCDSGVRYRLRREGPGDAPGERPCEEREEHRPFGSAWRKRRCTGPLATKQFGLNFELQVVAEARFSFKGRCSSQRTPLLATAEG